MRLAIFAIVFFGSGLAITLPPSRRDGDKKNQPPARRDGDKKEPACGKPVCDVVTTARDAALYITGGAAVGFIGMQILYFLGEYPLLLRFGRDSSERPVPAGNAGQATEPTLAVHDTVAGTWHLDPAKSESLEPFLVAVGVPRIVAKLTGRRSAPMKIEVSDTGAVSVRVGSKYEKFQPGATTTLHS